MLEAAFHNAQERSKSSVLKTLQVHTDEQGFKASKGHYFVVNMKYSKIIKLNFR